MSKSLILFLTGAIFLFSCAQSQTASHSSDANRIVPPFRASQTEDPNLETIAVVAINDFHGTLLPKERKLPDGRIVKSGGAEALAAMIKILREEMKGRVAVVDAGDEWQGTLESNLTKGETVVQFYNRLGVNVAAIGNHEFDFGIENMTHQFGNANYGYVASNIYKKKSSHRPTWKNVTPSTIFEIDGYKIGVVGYSTLQTPTTTRYQNVANLDFRDPLKPVVSEATKLRKKGVNLVLVTAHAGTVCEDKKGLKDWTLWSQTSDTSNCDDEQEIVKLADGLKPGQVDGIISGHTHQVIHHFFNHIPVVQDEAFNQFFNILYFTFNRKTHALLPEMTQIEGLIPICLEVFQGTSHCDVRRLKAGESPKLTQAYFHGHPVMPDESIEAWLKPIQEGTEKYRHQIIARSELPLSHFRDQESPFGNLMADVLRDKAKSDFALVNSGGIRTSLDAGVITYDGLYRALPFDNLLNVLKMTGRQVKLMMRLATSGTHGWPGVSGLRLTVIPLDQDAPKTDLNGDGKLERWETNRLLKVETEDGKPIVDHKIYTLATYDFLVTGGDDMKFVMDQIPKNRVSLTSSGYCRDLAIEYFAKHPVINTKEHPLVDPNHPRIFYQSKQ